MQVIGKLELEKEEERLWSLVKHGRYGYVGVESPGGRLVGINLETMQRLGYATASQFPLLAGLVVGDRGYFSAGSNPATVMRLELLKMQQGKCADWAQCRYEVSLDKGEEAVRAMFTDESDQFLVSEISRLFLCAFFSSETEFRRGDSPRMFRMCRMSLQ